MNTYYIIETKEVEVMVKKEIKNIDDLKDFVKEECGEDIEFVNYDIDGNYLSVLTGDLRRFVCYEGSNQVLSIDLETGGTVLYTID
jgi:hypothetical protein